MEEIEDILMEQKPDRRLLPNVPDPELQRTNSDRRGANADDIVDKVKKNIHVQIWMYYLAVKMTQKVLDT